ncbi:MAG: DUF2683 family protein [Candidatus Nanoarchaeia archaeon]|nr:DUF2683 family protein [Candidatus Nanoarchaeia archaeon]
MVQAFVNLSENANKVLNILKAKHALKDKSEAINMMAKEYQELILEPELRPEYVEKLIQIKKQKGIKFKSVAELRKHLENA